MQQIEVKINKRDLGDKVSFYEVSIPVIRIGELKYIRSSFETVYLTDIDTVIKSYRLQEMESNQIELIKADILDMYPEEVRERVVFTSLY